MLWRVRNSRGRPRNAPASVKLLVGLTIALACVASDTTASERQWARETRLAQASPDAGGTATGIGLTASHKQIIFDHVAGEDTQTLSNDPELTVGNTIPDALILNTMPIAVKDQI